MLLEVNFTADVVGLLLPLALILIMSKLLSLGAKKIGMPQIVGLLLAGVLLGLLALIPNVGDYIYGSNAQVGIAFIAEIGVILIMFSAGLETNVGAIKKTGVSALVITLLGVVVPMGFGFLAALILPSTGNTTNDIFRNLFYGVILTATSVSVTIAALKELGRLNSKIGTAIVSAAILDDIIGVVILSIILSLNSSINPEAAQAGGELDFVSFVFSKMLGESFNETGWSIAIVLIKTVLFFVFAIGIGLIIRKGFKKLKRKYDHTHRVVIFSLAVAFFYAFIAEKGFGIADITGAFLAGLMLSSLKGNDYVESKTEVTSWLLFTPVFFAKVGLGSMQSIADVAQGTGEPITWQFILFGVIYIIAGIGGKLFGCGVGAKATGFNFKDSLRCGVGMMCRAEVCLICADKGIKAGLVNPNIQLFLLVLILVTSFTTPIILKATYKNEPLEIDYSSIEADIAGTDTDITNHGPSLDQ